MLITFNIRQASLIVFSLLSYGTMYADIKVPVIHLREEVKPKMYTHFLQQLKTACSAQETQAILIDAESPGGQLYYPFLKSIAACNLQKRVWVLISNLCASACYYTAVAAHRIIASPLAMIGSIGTRFDRNYIDSACISKEQKNFTIHINTFSKGTEYCDVSKYEPILEHERTYHNQRLQSSYDNFIDYIYAHRPSLQEKNASEWANAKMFFAQRALQLGLIDKIGSLSDALDEIAQEFKVKTQDIQLLDNAEFKG